MSWKKRISYDTDCNHKTLKNVQIRLEIAVSIHMTPFALTSRAFGKDGGLYEADTDV